MGSPDNILLRLFPEDEARVREVYAELAARGFPPQQQTPHITVTFAPVMPAAPVDAARTHLAGLLPADFSRVGTVIFGIKSKRTVAWLLETTEELESAARAVSAANQEGRGDRWIPHLTMGLRIPRSLEADYTAALDDIARGDLALRNFRAQRAVLWSPRTQTETALA